MKIVQVPLPVREVDWIHLNHLLLVHPQLVHLQPVACTQNTVSGNQNDYHDNIIMDINDVTRAPWEWAVCVCQCTHPLHLIV